MNKIRFFILISVALSLSNCELIGSKLIKMFSGKYETAEKIFNSKPVFINADEKRDTILVSLNEITSVKEPTDIQFPPNDSPFMFLLEKKGSIILYDRRTQKTRKILQVQVTSESELGLLGLAFHPDYPKTPLLYLNYTKEISGSDYTIISEWKADKTDSFEEMKIGSERILFQVYQPYPNHNAGQLAFGKDKMLYIGFGDGGLRGDPKNHGQNKKTLLGSMVRISPIADDKNKIPYTIPADNPFVGNADYLPEIYAIGLRNPWRYSFSPDGHLLVSDVGQDKFEEVDIVESGKNYGWSETEGFHCYKDDCNLSLYSPPIYEYGHDEGQSITGGYVYSGSEISGLKDKYVFGDFISGRIWAFNLPSSPTKQVEKVYALGKWNILISTFGRDQRGDIFIGDYQSGKIFKMIPQAK
ncbi:MAG: PQQ-dependent sugar dehydrogenase [Leptospira sp.]|nr:PQQ-dependent sugar dehydrogenase [Leptospira sp.]